jgi:DNA-binding IclR family transcriptional regulator
MQGLFRTVQLLELLGRDARGEATLGELGRESRLPPSTVHRLLKALQSVGFVSQDAASGRYRLGSRLLHLGLRVSETIELRSVARPYMEGLTAKTLETTYLTVADDLYGVIVEKVESPQNIRLFESLGARIPLNCGASRKVLLAYMADDTIDRLKSAGLLVPKTSSTVTDADVLRRQLTMIRAQGYGHTSGENTAGAGAIAVPLRDWSDKVVASLSIAGPIERFKPRMSRLRDFVIAAGQAISRELGHSGTARDGRRENTVRVPAQRRARRVRAEPIASQKRRRLFGDG